MANPLFKQFGNTNNNNLFSQFGNFMQQMKGQNPNTILNNMINSGQISQSQLNQAQNMANQLQSQLEGIRHNFGF